MTATVGRSSNLRILHAELQGALHKLNNQRELVASVSIGSIQWRLAVYRGLQTELEVNLIRSFIDKTKRIRRRPARGGAR